MEKSDDRGYFLRVFDEEKISFDIKQASYAKNLKVHTLRGMHFQRAPFAESKLITCTEGEVFDVVVDTQRASSTFGKYKSFILGENAPCNSILIPRGFAHGYLTLTEVSSLLYFMDTKYREEFSSGFAWDDKEVKIDWPYKPKVISVKDSLLTSLRMNI